MIFFQNYLEIGNKTTHKKTLSYFSEIILYEHLWIIGMDIVSEIVNGEPPSMMLKIILEIGYFCF